MKTFYLSKRFFILVFFSATLVGGLAFSAFATGQTLSGKIIVVDAGHGGIDPGANRSDILEKEINLAVALQLKDALKQYGAKVILTRDTDVELSKLCDNEKVRGRYRRDLNARLEMIEESDADLFVSIHANASPKSQRRGIECYYSAQSEHGKMLALAIQSQLSTIALVSQNAKSADYFVLRRNKIPAILIEVGYITNPEERVTLQSPAYQRKLAEVISCGIENYYRSSFSASK